jgi:hypothetical protein
MATLWADTFGSGNALSVSYTDVVSAVSGESDGYGHSWGVHMVGTDAERPYGQFQYVLPSPQQTEYVRVSAKLNHAETEHAVDSAGYPLFEIWDHGAWGVRLSHGRGADHAGIAVYSAKEGASPVATLDSVLVAKVWKTIEMEVWYSTGGGMAEEPNADGRIRVTINDIEYISATGIKVISNIKFAHGSSNQIESVYCYPMGNADDLGIYDAAGGLWVDVANYIDQDLDSHDFLNGEVRVLLDLWSGKSGVPVKARLYNVSDGQSVAESAEVASTAPEDASFTATLALGLNTYRLQVGCETPGVDIFAIGQIEII